MRIKNTDNWIIIDENWKVIQGFRHFLTAQSSLPKLKKIFVGLNLKIVSVETLNEHKKASQNRLKLKRKVFDRWD